MDKRLIWIFLFVIFLPFIHAATFGYNSAEIIVSTTQISGDCPDGQFIQNVTSGGDIECAASAGSGDITAVNAGTGLTGGGENGDVTLNVNATTCGGGQVSKYDGNQFTCVTDQTGGAGGNPFDQVLNTTSNVTFFNATTQNVNTGSVFANFYNWIISTVSSNWLSFNGSELSFNDTYLNLTIDLYNLSMKSYVDATAGDSWANNFTDYFNKTDVLGFSYYNITDFDISNYFTSAEVLGFSYYNSTDFNINDYLLESNTTLVGNFSATIDFCIAGGNCLSAVSAGIDSWAGNFTDYFNITDILGFSYYNSTDFDINDYATFSIVNSSIGYYNSTMKSYVDSVAADTNETGRFNNLTSTGCTAGNVMLSVNNNGTINCVADADSGVTNLFDQILNTTSNVTFNRLNLTEGWGNVTIIESQVTNLIHNGTTDTNETIRFNALNGTDCSGTDKVSGVLLNGSLVCDTDQTGGVGGNPFDQVLNTTSNVTFFNATTQNVITNIIYTTFFRTLTTGFFWNMYDDGSDLILNVTNGGGDFQIEQENTKLKLFNSPVTGNDFKVFQVFSKEASDITEFTVTKAGDGLASYFIRSLAIAGNATNNPTPFNCTTFASFIDCSTDTTGADLWVEDDIEFAGLIYGNGSQLTGLTLTEADPFWSGNQSLYSNTSVIVGWGHYNITDFDISNYPTLAEVLGFSYYNSTDFDINDYATFSIVNSSIGYYNSTMKSYVDSVAADTNETGRFNNLTSTGCTAGNVMLSVNDNGTINCVADADSGSTNIFNQILNTTSNVTFNRLNLTGGWGNVTIIESQVTNLIHNGTTDTNETIRFNALNGTDCSGTDKVSGVLLNGSLVCDTDQTGGGASKNASGDLVYNDTTTIYFNRTQADVDLEVNGSDYWDGLNIFNVTQMENSGGTLSILVSWLISFLIQTTDEPNLNVNGSDWWDGLDTPADINAGDITDDNTYATTTGDTFTGNVTMGNNYINNQTANGGYIYHNGTGWVIVG